MSILGLSGIAEIVEDGRFSCQRVSFQNADTESEEIEEFLTWILRREVISIAQR